MSVSHQFNVDYSNINVTTTSVCHYGSLNVQHPLNYLPYFQVSDWSFPMDRVFHNAAQESVYNNCVSQIVDKALDGKEHYFRISFDYLFKWYLNTCYNPYSAASCEVGATNNVSAFHVI